MKLLLRVVLVTNLIVCDLFSTGLAYLLDTRCGLPVSGRISGGQNAELQSKPWMVYLHTNNQYICGGSLISTWFILTAGHCFGDNYNNVQIWARLGEHNSELKKDCNYYKCAPEPREYSVTTRIRYPNYTSPKYHDIALGRLDRKVIYSESIRPICLVMDSGYESYVNSLRFFVVSGWGATEFVDESSILQTTFLKNVDLYKCYYTYGYDVDRTHICAGDLYHYAGPGDSGSPLGSFMDYYDENNFFQFGIVSHRRTSPFYGVSVFTNVLAYRNWIYYVVTSYN